MENAFFAPHRLVLTSIVLAVLLVGGCGSSQPAADRRETAVPPLPDGLFVVGYHAWWTRESWRTYDFTSLDELLFFQVELNGNGTLADRHGWPDVWFPMTRAARSQGVGVAPTVTIFDQEKFVGLFGSSEARQTLLRTLTGLLEDATFSTGLHLDFEIYRPVPPEVRANLTTFVRDLRGAMDEIRPGLSLSMFLPAFDQSDVFDETALARYASYFVVQGYDLHARRDEQAGPVAALDRWGRRNWRAIVQRLKDLGIPPRKIVMAVPYFGYEWPTVSDAPGARTRGPGTLILHLPVDTTYLQGARKVGPEEASRHGARRESLTGTPYYAYRDSTGWWQGWYEDEPSLRAKYAFVQDEGLGGVALFTLGYGNDALWRLLRESFLPVQP